jgi:hypothetical protein
MLLGDTALESWGSSPVAGPPTFPTRQSRPTFGTWPWRGPTYELANFNIVAEKWDSSEIGGKRGGSTGKQGGAKGYTTTRSGTSNTRAAAQDAAGSIQDAIVWRMYACTPLNM